MTDNPHLVLTPQTFAALMMFAAAGPMMAAIMKDGIPSIPREVAPDDVEVVHIEVPKLRARRRRRTKI